jgi:hypothetical protein
LTKKYTVWLLPLTAKVTLDHLPIARRARASLTGKVTRHRSGLVVMVGKIAQLLWSRALCPRSVADYIGVRRS